MTQKSNSTLAPILMFVYNRPDHTERTLNALKKNELASDSDLVIYSDAPKNDTAIEGVKQVRELIKNVSGFKSVTLKERDRNWGLAPSIIDGVTQMVNHHGKVIVLEDDLVTNPYFLKFMNNGLERYENDDRVASIHGFIYPIENLPSTFFIRGADCWGWATWKRGWDIFNADGQALLNELEERQLTDLFDYHGAYGYTQMIRDQIAGKVSSWAVRWYASAFLKDKLTLYPGNSLVKNIGFDVGTHCQNGEDEPYFGTLSANDVAMTDIAVVHDEKSFIKIEKFLKKQKKSLFVRAFNKAKRILKG